MAPAKNCVILVTVLTQHVGDGHNSSNIPCGSGNGLHYSWSNFCGNATMNRIHLSRLAVLAAALSLSTAVQAADLILTPEPMAEVDAGLTLPAVSGLNGKIELWGGAVNFGDDYTGALFSGEDSVASYRIGGSLSAPIGDAFGIQGDVGFGKIGDQTFGGGMLHLFTRDPASYLFGAAAGYVATDGASLAAVGPEAELYLDRVSLETWLGWASYDNDFDPLDETGFFGFVNVAYYVTDDWRVSLGVQSILGDNAFDLSTEYQFTGLGLPLSITAEFKAFDNDSQSIMVGLKGYFGDPDKSLIDRHRQDDPQPKVFNLFDGAGNCQVGEILRKYDPESACGYDPRS
jgi:hypothetical protein